MALSLIKIFVKKNLFLICLIVISLFFFLLLGKNVSPFLRGPAPYPPDWRWEYVFVNTTQRLWAPILSASALLGFGWFVLKNKKLPFPSFFLLSFFVFLAFVFEISVLYYSRSGIFVLLHRIINPDLNGYFTASLAIKDITLFLKTYNAVVLHLPMHATGHPPGAILFFSLLHSLVNYFPAPHMLMSTPSHADVAKIWIPLSLPDRFTAVLAAGLIPFLSCLVIFPLFSLTKYLYNQKTAWIAVLLYCFLPSVTLFIPINDTILSLFSLTTTLWFIKGLNTKEYTYMILSGVVFFIGLFFSTSLLPLVCMLGILACIKLWGKFSKKTVVLGLSFLFGLSLFPTLLFIFFQFNFFQVAMTLMKGLPQGRSYLTWLPYNAYAFFLFAGIPSFPLFILQMKQELRLLGARKIQKMDSFFFGFTVMIGLLLVSGAVRGEVERIWLPYMPLLTIIISHRLATKFPAKNYVYLVIAAILAIQIIVFQTFLVTLW